MSETNGDQMAMVGRALLETMREMFDDAGLGSRIDFDEWVDRSPQPPNARRAIELARKAKGTK
ncbi:MAG: hypothetical protein H0U59_11145 [Gemmatimonadaceae bacterium]|nr:hypothetical protein [Gemmatimonadaceae bacterium]